MTTLNHNLDLNLTPRAERVLKHLTVGFELSYNQAINIALESLTDRSFDQVEKVAERFLRQNPIIR